ncbi:MAG: Sialate O-acetylesterase [Firmicutes bacterium]|nr:Sialate O-acetylesterase [Bacillota bacterium]
MSSWISLPAHFSSGMILQQQAGIHLSGRTDPNLDLSLELTCAPFENHAISPLDPNYGVVFAATVTSDRQGKFAIDLPPFKASFDPYVLRLTDGQRHFQLNDILVGEIYLLVGDDVLQTRMASPGVNHASDLSRMPFLRFFDMAQDPQIAHWHAADHTAQIGQCSAIGLSFGRDLMIELKIPIGLVQAIQTGHRLHDWLPARKKGLFERLLQPLASFNLRGIIWSGSEHDLADPDRCRPDLMKLAQSLRALFHPFGDLPPAFLMLQYRTFYAGQKFFYQQMLCNEALAYAAHQLEAPTALIPVSGTNTSNHLQTIASRLRTVGLGLVYQRKAPRSAPECESIELVGGKMILSFSNAGEGLRLTGDDTRVRGFTVCGSDHIFREASARVLYGVRVMVWHDDVPNPVGVTYGFYDMNQRANLISKDQLPVVPFRSDQADAVYCCPQEWLHCDEADGWQIYDGRVDLQREKANKSEGEASLKLTYQTGSDSSFALGPVIDQPASFPPLDLHHMNRLLIDLFNPDRQEKTVQLSLMAIAAPGARAAASAVHKVVPALRWQTIEFDLDQLGQDLDLAQIIKLKLVFADRTGRGMIYLDNIRYGYR